MKSGGAKQYVRYAGAVVAYLIGSGFASGQEVMQFFTAYGPMYGLIGGCITLVIMVLLTGMVMKDACALKLDDANDIFTFYCGKYLGEILKWLMPVFLYSIYVIMLAGAGSMLEEYYGIPNIYGRFIMLALSLGTVLLGLNKLTSIIGFIGPLIIIMTVAIGSLCIFKNTDGLSHSGEAVAQLSMVKASPYWWLSGINYGSFCGLTLVPFLVGIGRQAEKEKTVVGGSVLGSLAFSFAAMLLSGGMLAYIENVYDKAVPTVYLADMLHNGAGTVFSLIMFAGIFTTAVPMLWTTANKLVQDEKSLKYKVVTTVLAGTAFFGGALPFGTLVNIVYPYMGYVGMLVFAFVLFKYFSKERNAKE